MKVAIRCIYYKAVTPSCDIVEMDGDININVNYGDDNDAEQGEQE